MKLKDQRLVPLQHLTSTKKTYLKFVPYSLQLDLALMPLKAEISLQLFPSKCIVKSYVRKLMPLKACDNVIAMQADGTQPNPEITP